MNQVVISLPQLIDLGLGSPEVGAVNFNVLHSVLHIIIQQLNATNLNVEFKGNDATRIEALLNRNEPGLKVTVSDPSITLEKGESQFSVLDSKNEIHEVIEGVEKSSESLDNLSINKSQTVIVQTFGGHVADHTFVSKEVLKKVENRVEKIEKQILGIVDVPTNTQIIETLRSRSQHSIFDKSRPIFEMWQTLNLNKRVDAVETTIEKVSGFVEDLVRSTPVRQQEVHLSPKSSVAAVVVIDDKSEKDSLNLKSFLNDRGGVEKFFENYDEMYNQIQEWRNLFGEIEIEALVTRINDLEVNLQEVMSRQNAMTEFQPHELIERIASLDISLKELSKELQRVDDKYEGLFEKIETLNTVKATYEDLEDALAQKADILALNEKVSTTEFNQCLNNTLESIENIMHKLNELEQLCQNDLNEIQIQLAMKTNKSDLDSVQDFLLKRINELNSQLKSFSILKEEQEASGAKNKYIRDLKCISCDNHVYMTKDLKEPVVPKLKPMIPKNNYNLPSFISYKLDALRKSETTPCALNLNKFEEALNREKKDLVNRKFANMGRTCGGKYTVTAPVERVTKIGNFLSQWNQGCDNVEHTFVQGTDGKMYRAVKVVPLNDDDCSCYYDNADRNSMND